MRSTSSLALLMAMCAIAPLWAGEPCPVRPGDPAWMERQMQRREDAVAAERERAIELLNGFLRDQPAARERADALFRLAELLWERSERELLASMRAYEESIEAFRAGRIRERPGEPRIDLRASLAVYEQILEKHPDFSQTDMVLYLYGFALNEHGDEETALSIYRTLLKRFPNSAFAADAHLALGEYAFTKGRYAEARQAYQRVMDDPQNALYDLAAYKAAWCFFKEGQAQEAALRFREVLRRSRERRESGRRVQTAAGDLENEALEDLALTFSESGGAREALRFMGQVGGEDYSIRVLRSLGEVFLRQARFDEAVDAFRSLVDNFPLADDGPEHQARVVEALERRGRIEESLRERRRLAERFGPGSSWLAEHRQRPELAEKAVAMAEENLRQVALRRHKQAQEKKDAAAYEVAVVAYQDYLKIFPSAAESPRMHFLVGEALYQLGRFEPAALNYLTAAEHGQDPGLRREAAYAAVLAYDRLRPKSAGPVEPAAREEVLSSAEAGFVRAVEMLGRLSSADEKLPALRFECGRIFYARAQFSRAAEHLLALVRNHPKDPLAEAAADLALDSFTRLRDWKSLEKEARAFQQQKTFVSGEMARKLPSIISAAIFRGAGEHLKEQRFSQAAAEYLRLVKEFPADPLAPQALFNRGTALDQAGEKAAAVEAFQQVIARYPAQAAEASIVMAGLLERQYDYEKSARHYAAFAERFREDARAPDALLLAARLENARGAYDGAARLLLEFTRTWPRHPKAPEALLAAGIALMQGEKPAEAERAFQAYLEKHAEKQKRVRESSLLLARALLAQGKAARARELIEKCGAFPARKPPEGSELEAAAHCRFLQAEQVFEEYRRIELKPPKTRLIQALKDKAQLLAKAEGLFAQVVAAGHLEWASAALFRVGDMYAQFSEAIYRSPTPPDLKPDEVDIYRQELQALAFPIEDKALKAFGISHETALRYRYFSVWSQRTLQMLRKLDPARFPPEEEVRPGYRWADSLTVFPLVQKPLPVPPAPAPAAGGPR
ncbi:MAG: tetratricopeptide repeat protein [Myxococcales bacterium]|nr:tetratricopeptide repeat protein [Myxococcales bacterium]